MNGLAIASLVMAVLWLGGVGSLLAVVFGHVALRQVEVDGRQGGRGVAVAGLVIGYLGLTVLVLVFIAAMVVGTAIVEQQ